MKGFSGPQAARITGCSINQIRYWEQVGLVNPELDAGQDGQAKKAYLFAHLVELRLIKALLDGGMTLQRVRSAFEYLRERADFDDPSATSGVKLVTDGVTIFEICRNDGEILDALRRGQLALFIAVDEIEHEVAEDVESFLAERERFVSAISADR